MSVVVSVCPSDYWSVLSVVIPLKATPMYLTKLTMVVITMVVLMNLVVMMTMTLL